MRPILQLMNAQQPSTCEEEINKVRSKVLRQLLYLQLDLELKGMVTTGRRELVAHIKERLGVSRATAYDYAATLLLLNRKPSQSPNDFRPALLN